MNYPKSSSESEWQSLFGEIQKAGYNVINLSFYDASKKGDDNATTNWESLSPTSQQSLKSYLHKNKIALVLSVGGAGNAPVSQSCMYPWIDSTLADYAYKHNYDGVDFDLEGLASGPTNQECLKALSGHSDAIRKKYSQNGKKCIISSAPQTPYFNQQSTWTLNYIAMEKTYPQAFDYYNVQFYNNGNGNTQASTIGSGSGTAGNNCNASYMVAQGIPKHKLVVGKCGGGGGLCCQKSDYVGGKTLLGWVQAAGLKGIMYWVWDPSCGPGGAGWLTAT